jgi:hypothetical protein
MAEYQAGRLKMKTLQILVVGVVLVLLTGLPLLAVSSAPPVPEVTDDAAARVEEATGKHIDVLTGLLARVPEEARRGIEKALEASRRGHDAALAALAAAERRAEAERRNAVRAGDGRPDATGLARAREKVTAAFERSVNALQAVIARVPDEAADRVAEALIRVEEHRHVAIDNLNRLLDEIRPERPVGERPDRPDRPQRPDRPDRPDLPDRPEVPERPDVPDRP